MKKQAILLTITLVLASIFGLSTTMADLAYAEESETKPAVWLQISPPHKTLTLNPGDNYDGEFTVTNIGSEEFDFKVYASPFSVVGENYDHDYSSEKQYNQIYRWVTFEQETYTLAVNESQVVTYHIEVPEDVAAGSQHAVLFAESSGSSASGDASGIKAVSRVGMRLAASIPGDTRVAIEINDYQLKRLYLSFNGPKISASSKIKNTGNVDAEAEYSLTVNPFFGGETVYNDSKTQLIYPDSEYKNEMVWEHTPLLGLFSVTYSAVSGEASEEQTRVVFVIPMWLVIIVILLLTLLIVWIILKVKKRRQLRSKVNY